MPDTRRHGSMCPMPEGLLAFDVTFADGHAVVVEAVCLEVAAALAVQLDYCVNSKVATVAPVATGRHVDLY